MCIEDVRKELLDFYAMKEQSGVIDGLLAQSILEAWLVFAKSEERKKARVIDGSALLMATSYTQNNAKDEAE